MNKFVYAIACCFLALGLAPASVHAYETSQTYTGASPGIVGLTVYAIGFGGARFTATGDAPLSASVTDASGLPVYVNACQDTNGNGLCESNEPNAVGCGAVNLDASFNPNVDTIVFVYGTDLPSTSCTGLATTGTITLDYKDP